jgi:DNA-binding CsgD family transcriptional regulator
LTQSDKKAKNTLDLPIRIFGFSLLVACYFIMTNEAVPALRQADSSIVVYRALGMMLGYCLPAFLPTYFSRLMSKAYFQRILVAVLLLGIIACFLLVMLIPTFLFSGLFAFLIGIIAAIAVCLLVAVFKGYRASRLLLCMPYIFIASIALTLLMLLLPEPYHEYAILVSAVGLAVFGAVFQPKNQALTDNSRQPVVPEVIPQQSLIKILLIAAGLGVSNELIRLLAFDKLYEAPDIIYMAYCAITFLALLSSLCFALYKLKNIKPWVHILILVASLILLTVFSSWFTWIGHRGLFVFMGNATFFLGSVLLPLVYAIRKSISPVQTVGVVQFGVSLGYLLGFLSVEVVTSLNLAIEVQIAALFLSLVLLGVVLLSTIFGMRQNTAQTAATSPLSAQPSLDDDFGEHLIGEGLTVRQSEIAVLVAKGYSVPSIAEKFVISKKTVGNHLEHVYKTLSIHSKQELVTYYQQFGGDHR